MEKMKAYVIKSKEGKYCQITFNGWINFVSELCCAYIYHSKQGAEKIIKCHELEDCEVVEITIAEGDLEQQLAITKRALELACENIRDMYCSDYCTRTRDERCKEICYYEQYYDKEKFLDQAKEELEREKNNDQT